MYTLPPISHSYRNFKIVFLYSTPAYNYQRSVPKTQNYQCFPQYIAVQWMEECRRFSIHREDGGGDDRFYTTLLAAPYSPWYNAVRHYTNLHFTPIRSVIASKQIVFPPASCSRIPSRAVTIAAGEGLFFLWARVAITELMFDNHMSPLCEGSAGEEK